jgi:prevent-host-death family protein
MAEVASRDLRNDTAGVLRRVQAGEDVIVTVHGRPVARLVPFTSRDRHRIPWPELRRRLSSGQADAGLRRDLEDLAGDTTDDLGPIQ